MIVRMIPWVTIATLVACGPSDSPSSATTEALGSTSQALGTSALPPVPCNTLHQPAGTGASLWTTGTIPELMFADALAECSQTPSLSGKNVATLPPYLPLDPNFDSTLRYIANEMKSALGIGATDANYVAGWAAQRTNPPTNFSNCDETTLASGQPVSFVSTPVTQTIYELPAAANGDFTVATTTYADEDIRAAGLNLCIAQQLRNQTPGASGGAAVLLSDADQRELLQFVRERSQIAMLHYGELAEIFSLTWSGGTPTVNQRLPLLGEWAQAAANGTLNATTTTNELVNMSNDFATAVQMHVLVSTELAQLFSRSRSERALRGGTVPALPDDQWGPGSWYQRSMATLYGGDALAIGADGLWKPPAGNSTPAPNYGEDWPTFDHAPYVETEIPSPLPWQLLQLARQYDEIKLYFTQTNGSPPSCEDAGVCIPSIAGAELGYTVDQTYTTDQMYRNLEGHLRYAQANCATTAACTGIDLPPSGPPDNTWLLVNEYDISENDAATLVSYLNDALMLKNASTESPTDVYVGALDVMASDTNGDLTYAFTADGTHEFLHVSQATTLVPRRLEEIAAQFTRLAPVRFPLVTDLHPTTNAQDLGFAGTPPPAGGTTLAWQVGGESKRTMGAIPALAAVRSMLLSIADGLVHGPTLHTSCTVGGTSSTANNILCQEAGIFGVINGAIGPQQMALIPAVGTTPDPQSPGDSEWTVVKAPDHPFQGAT